MCDLDASIDHVAYAFVTRFVQEDPELRGTVSQASCGAVLRRMGVDLMPRELRVLFRFLAPFKSPVVAPAPALPLSRHVKGAEVWVGTPDPL